MLGADRVSPPRAGKVGLVDLTASTVATIDLEDFVEGPADVAGYWTFLASTEFYIITGPTGVADPDTTDDDDGDEPFGPWPASTPLSFVAAYGSDRVVKILPTEDGHITFKRG